jgi:hypothetical protein
VLFRSIEHYGEREDQQGVKVNSTMYLLFHFVKLPFTEENPGS